MSVWDWNQTMRNTNIGIWHTHIHADIDTQTHTYLRMYTHMSCINTYTYLTIPTLSHNVGEVWIDDCDPGWEEIIDTPDHRTRGWYNLATPTV